MWIEIEEGLPLPLQKVLITAEDHGSRFVLLAWFSGNKEWQYLNTWAGMKVETITHKIIAWSLFPKPYKD